jgi:hypothetical protein
MGGRRGVHRREEMAIAVDLVQLPVGQFEEPLRFTVAVVFQPGCAQDRIRESHRDRRTIAAHGGARPSRLILGLVQRREAPVRIPFEELRPAFKTFTARHGPARVVLIDLGDAVQLLEGMVLDFGLLFER